MKLFQMSYFLCRLYASVCSGAATHFSLCYILWVMLRPEAETNLLETWWIVNSTVYRGRQMGEEEEGEMKSSNREEKRSWKVMKELIKVSERCLCLMSVSVSGLYYDSDYLHCVPNTPPPPPNMVAVHTDICRLMSPLTAITTHNVITPLNSLLPSALWLLLPAASRYTVSLFPLQGQRTLIRACLVSCHV